MVTDGEMVQDGGRTRKSAAATAREWLVRVGRLGAAEGAGTAQGVPTTTDR